MKKLIILFILMTASINGFLFTTSVHAGGPIYSKPAFRGRIIDAETKEPIEGAVAVVLYNKEPLIGGPAGVSDYAFRAKEMLTDKKGEFYFPPYSSLLIFTKGTGVDFIFYKPGYMANYGPTNLDAFLTEKYFSSDVIGKEAEIVKDYGRPASYKGPLGIVELKKGEHSPSTPGDYRSDKLPLLYKAINEDRRNRGYKGEEK